MVCFFSSRHRNFLYYLPEVSSDSIFAIIGEEFGFIGSVGFLAAYLFLLYKGFKIVKFVNILCYYQIFLIFLLNILLLTTTVL